MRVRAITVIVIAVGANLALTATEPASPSKELVQYVLKARQQRLKDDVIRKNAVAVGWPAAVVNEAMRAAGNQNKTEASTPLEKAHAGVADSARDRIATATSAPAIAPVTSREGAPVIPSSPKNRGVPDDYQIGAGDVLQISVWKEPEASVPNVVVRPDGRISMPLLKEVAVMGMTPRDAEKAITDGLSDMIHAADVTVIVTSLNSKKIYVIGATKKEGPLAFTYRMTVMQAISEAGGLNDYAKHKKIYVLHTDNGKEYRLPFNYDEVIKGERMEQNIQLSAGDTVLIPH